MFNRHNDGLGWRFTIPVTIRFSVAWLLAVIAVGLAVVTWYNYSDDGRRRTIIFGTSVVGGILTIWGILQASENIRLSNTEKQRLAAFRFMERWNAPAFLEQKRAWRALNEELDSLPDKEAAKIVGDALEKRMAVSDVLNFFEEMAIAIRAETADEEMLKRYFRTVVLKLQTRYGFWMRIHRELRKAPRYWIEIESVMEEWRGD